MTARTAARILARYRARARRRASWMFLQWERGRTSPDQGLLITAGEIARLLEPAADTAAEEAAFAARPEIIALGQTIAAADRALASDRTWSGLCSAFALSRTERDLLGLALADALDPDFGRVLAYLADDAQQTRATATASARLCGTEAIQPLTPGSPLLRWRLVTPIDGVQDAKLRVDPAVLAFIVSNTWTDPLLDGIAAFANAGAAAMPVLQPDMLARMQAVAGAGPLRVDLLGAEGSGRQVLAAQLAHGLGRRLLVVDAQRIAASNARPAVALAARRMARATNAILFWRHADALEAETAWPAHLIEDIRALPAEGITRPDAVALTIGPTTVATRLAAWHHWSTEAAPALLRSQRLTPGEIALIARAAPAGPEAIRLALRRTAPPGDGVLSRLSCPYDWDDLIGPPETTAQLREIMAQVRLRWEVYEDWGFGRLMPTAQGISVLLAGPSGTGKTMAAQVLARALGLDLYRIDLAGVVNKYIGETEKRLRAVFEFGERSGVILFFDEADALFGSRTQVKDSHDRFANIEVDYLLQRIEQFDGIAILATNRKSDIDTAFLRRLRFVVDFVPPGPAQCLAIWQRSLPATTPSGAKLCDPIDWTLLAEQLPSLTGAEIKSATMSAAFLARAEGTLIGMRHVLAGVQREMTKRGRTMRLRPAAAGAAVAVPAVAK